MVSNGVIGGLESWQITEGIKGKLETQNGKIGEGKEKHPNEDQNDAG